LGLGELLAQDFLSIGEQGFVLGNREWIRQPAGWRIVAIQFSTLESG
jgi:hypothetical protein